MWKVVNASAKKAFKALTPFCTTEHFQTEGL